MRYVDLIISVNEQIARSFNSVKERVLIKEAFIPPAMEDEGELPFEILQRIKQERNRKTLICANAFKLTLFNGKELYGLDQCIEVAKMIKHNELPYFIFFVVSTIGSNKKLYNSFLSEILREQLEEYILIIPKSISFISLMKECQIVLRPTLSDGDALTIREALYFNRKVIASDIISRPPGVTLYKTGDYKDLYVKIKDYNQTMFSDGAKNEIYCIREDYHQFYRKLYKTCYNSPKS